MNTASPATNPVVRASVEPNLRHAFEGIWRISYRRMFSRRQWFNLGWPTLVLGLITAVTVRYGNSDSFFTWMVDLYLTTLVPIFAFMGGAGAIREDMKPGVVDYLLTRPMPRPAFVVARFFSHLACEEVMFLVPFGAVLAVGFQRDIPDLSSTWPLLLQAQMLTVLGFTALGFLFGACTSRYLVLGINYAALVEVGLGQIPIQLSKLSVLRNIKNLLLPVTPESFSPAAEPQGFFTSLLFVGLLSTVWLLATTAVFSLQEFAGQRPKEA